MKFAYPLILLLIVLVHTYFLGLAVTSRIPCSKQVFYIFGSQLFLILIPPFGSLHCHKFNHLHQLHHYSPLKSVLTPRIKPCNYRKLQFFPGCQSYRSVDDYNALNLDPYVSSHSITVNHSSKPSSGSNPLFLSQQSDHVTPSDTVLPSHYAPPSDNIKPSDNVIPSNNVSLSYYIKPSDNVLPSNNIKPSDNVLPSDNVQPSDNIKSSDNVLPSDTIKPSDNVLPSDNFQPSDNIKPADNVLPLYHFKPSAHVHVAPSNYVTPSIFFSLTYLYPLILFHPSLCRSRLPPFAVYLVWILHTIIICITLLPNGLRLFSLSFSYSSNHFI